MQIRIQPFHGTPRAFMEAFELPFAWTVTEATVARLEPRLELDRALAAYDGDRVVGTAGLFSLAVTVPGGAQLPMAGVTMVAVHPTHRRRGILRSLMRRQLDDLHEQGREPIAGLWASESSIYQRFGYGPGTLGASFAVERTRGAFHVPHEWSGTLRLVEPDEAQGLLPAVFEAVHRTRPGSFARSAAWWEGEFYPDPPEERKGGAAASLVVHEVDGAVTGYARYRVTSGWDNAGPRGSVEVHELMTTRPATHADLWRYLLDLDLVREIRGWNLPVDDPLPLLVAEPRGLNWTVRDGLWLRIVDVAGALAGRRYAAAGRLVLELADEVCDWNAGRWLLETDEDGAPRVTPTSADPDLALRAADLAALYLGAWRVADLVRANRIAERRPGAAARADAMLRTAAAPWTPRVF